MLWGQRLWMRVQMLFRRERATQQLEDEMQFHLEQQIAENVAAGMNAEEACYAARRSFGNRTEMVGSTRETWGWLWLEQMAQDLRYALRRLRMAPAFTTATVLTLALGIGATTSIFTLVHAVLLKSLPVVNPGELYRLGKESRCCYQGGYSQEKEFSLVSYELYKYLRDHTHGFAALAAFPAPEPLFGVRRAGTSEAAQSYPGEFVSGNYFSMLKEQAATQFTQQRLIARLTSLFGVLSLVLASIGLYGITAYNVGRRTSEIGVRIALGANRATIIRLVLQGAFLLIAFGLILGLPLSLGASRVLSSQLYGLNPYDPILMGLAVAVLGVFALTATLIPALRASSISPSQALRTD